MRGAKGKTVWRVEFLLWYRSDRTNAVNSVSGVNSARPNRWLISIHGVEPITVMVIIETIFVSNENVFEG